MFSNVTGSYRLQREILTLCLTCPAQERPRGEFVVVEQAHNHYDHHSHHDDYDHDLHKLQFSCNIKRQKELRTVQNEKTTTTSGLRSGNLLRKKLFSLILTKRWQQSQINIHDDYSLPNW